MKFHGMGEETTLWGQTRVFAGSWKENELEWKMFKSEKGPSKQLKTKMTEASTCWTCSISKSQRRAGAAAQGRLQGLQKPRAVSSPRDAALGSCA